MKHKAEIFDKMQYLYDVTRFNDHQLHCVIRFAGKVNAGALRAAVQLLLSAIPALSRMYISRGGDSWWEENVGAVFEDLFVITDSEAAFDRFTFSKTNEETGPQLKVCLLSSETDAVSIIMNHMVSDAAGFKQCVYLLSSFYSRLLSDPSFVPADIIDGDRSYTAILKGLPFLHKMRILLLNNRENNKSNPCRFPFGTDEIAEPFILTHEIPPEQYARLRQLCKDCGATVNDVLLAAYFRALSNMLNLNGRALSLPIMIDMRRYLADKRFVSLTNLSSTVIIALAVIPGETLNETVKKVAAAMTEKKSGDLGLNPFVKLHVLFKACGNRLGYHLLQKSLKNPEICMTNIGLLDSRLLTYGDTPITNAYMCGSIKYRPHFQMSVSTFQNKMTLCVNLYGSPADRTAIVKFFDLMDNELLE